MKIKIQKQPAPKKRAAVIVKPEVYGKIYELSHRTNTPIETITNILLEEALKEVEVVE